MFDRFAEQVAPTNIIEWMWLRDIVDLCWEIGRLHRYRMRQIEEKRERENAKIAHMRKCADEPGRWNDMAPAAIEARQNWPMLDDEVDSATLLIARDPLETYETIDKLLAAAELRRDRILRELDMRRERIAPLLRKKSDELIDAR